MHVPMSTLFYSHQTEDTNDPLIVNGLMYVCKVIHDALKWAMHVISTMYYVYIFRRFYNYTHAVVINLEALYIFSSLFTDDDHSEV